MIYIGEDVFRNSNQTPKTKSQLSKMVGLERQQFIMIQLQVWRP